MLEILGSERRLNRIMGLLRRCRYSFHDLSRVELDASPPETPRLNMPFELGLAVALRQTLRRRHAWFVLEAKAYRPGGVDERPGTRPPPSHRRACASPTYSLSDPLPPARGGSSPLRSPRRP